MTNTVDLSTTDARVALARKYAAKYGLDPYLVCAVIEQESNWNPWAVRFEPGFLEHYVRPVNPLKPTTAEICRAMSFGLMQVMGLVAIGLGWKGIFLTDLCDPDIGVDFGCRRLQRGFDKYSGDSELALLDYNGGGNILYAAQVLARVGKYEPAQGAD